MGKVIFSSSHIEMEQKPLVRTRHGFTRQMNLSPKPREYRHTLSTLVSGLIERGFVIRHLSDSTDFSPDPNATPGTWEHFTAIAPPWLTFWALYQP